MAVVSEEILRKNLSAENLCPVYVFFGQDNYLKKNYSDKIRKRITDKDDILNYAFFENNCNLQEVYDFVMQMPMMADKKYAEILDYNYNDCSKSDFNKLCELVSQVPDTAVLVLRFENIEIDLKKDKNFKALLNAVEKNGGIVVNLPYRKSAELVKMLCDGAAKRGSKIDNSTASYLIETVGNDILILKNELEKLCAFQKNETITKEIVDLVCPKSIETSIFNITRGIFSCNPDESLKILDELLYMKLEPIVILHTIASGYIDMYRVYCAKEQKLQNSSILEIFNYKNKEFLLDKASVNLKKFDDKKLRLSLDALIEADNKIKSSSGSSRLVLEQLIVKLIYIVAKGEAIVEN